MTISGYTISTIDLVLVLCALFFIAPIFRKLIRKSSNKLNIDGKLIWVDKGRTKPFYNKVFKVLGKPDLMYKIKSGILAVEYKSRNANIYASDIAQGKAAALAARGSGYNVTELMVLTKNNRKRFPLPKSDKALYSEVERLCQIVRSAKRGKSQPSMPSKFKCHNCAYANSCKKK